jgi:starch synthase
MNILHVSAECFPVAKVGGLADVVGALPKYQTLMGHEAKVVMPMHKTNFLFKNEWEVVHKSQVISDGQIHIFTIIKALNHELGFELFCVDVHGLLDREKVYGYDDDPFRYLIFQLAVLEWLKKWEFIPDVVHVHDHHAGLIPFLMKHGYDFVRLKQIKTILTIHNAQYQGWMSKDNLKYFPAWDEWKTGMLFWRDQINSLACAVKCAERVSTVSPTYMKQLAFESNGLEDLFLQEFHKCKGIINGIDEEVWDPATDKHLPVHFQKNKIQPGKKQNKQLLCEHFGFDAELPLFVFIGRMVDDKGGDILPSAIEQAFRLHQSKMNVVVLGSGNPEIEKAFAALAEHHPQHYRLSISYNEPLSHRLYASADFLLMPSKVEPCGLNQLYALRYGTIPIVRRTGGLNDTVVDFGDAGGFGICFNQSTVEDIIHSINRALDLFGRKREMNALRKKMMNINHGWHESAKEYLELYQQ